MVLNGDCFELITEIKSKSIDLILTDPPYLISRDSNFINGSMDNRKMSSKYKMSIDFGDWDKIDMDWNLLLKEYYRVLKYGGTLIIFYDIWKSGEIKKIAQSCHFRQPRIGQWQKTNPVPVNSKSNYLSNAIEYFFVFVKGKNPKFNSKYDSGIYRYPICKGYERYKHPTQKPLKLFVDIINKHSDCGDVVLDTFAGTGTTAHACSLTGRDFIVMEKDNLYYQMIQSRLNKFNIDTINKKNEKNGRR